MVPVSCGGSVIPLTFSKANLIAIPGGRLLLEGHLLILGLAMVWS
jgi:hypothetical protein